MTIQEKKRIENLLKARLKDRSAIRAASQAIDGLRRKFGGASESFDSLAILRHLRAAR